MAGPVKGKTTLDRTCHMKGMVDKMGRGQTQCTLFLKNNCLDNGVHFIIITFYTAHVRNKPICLCYKSTIVKIRLNKVK